MLMLRCSDLSPLAVRSCRLVSQLITLCVIVLGVSRMNAQCVDISSYGGSGNGTTDNSPALLSAFSHLPSTGGCIAFSGGRYLFKTTVTLNYPASGIFSLSLAGAGADNTTLYWAASNGIAINTNNATQTVHVRDVTFSTGTAGTYSALTITNAHPLGTILGTDVFRSTFRGDDGGAATDYWNAGVNIVGQSNVNFESDQFFGRSDGTVGSGIVLNGNTNVNPYFGIVYNIAKCGFFWTGNGLAIGTYIQGVSVTQSNFTNGYIGIYVLPGGTGFDELAVTGGNQFNTTQNQIVIQQPYIDLIVNGNLFFCASNNSGIYLDATGSRSSVINNVFIGNLPSFGIYVAKSSPGAVVSGNVFNNLTNGVNLVGTSGWNVQGNSYQNVGTNVASVGTNSVGVATQ